MRWDRLKGYYDLNRVMDVWDAPLAALPDTPTATLLASGADVYNGTFQEHQVRLVGRSRTPAAAQQLPHTDGIFQGTSHLSQYKHTIAAGAAGAAQGVGWLQNVPAEYDLPLMTKQGTRCRTKLRCPASVSVEHSE